MIGWVGVCCVQKFVGQPRVWVVYRALDHRHLQHVTLSGCSNTRAELVCAWQRLVLNKCAVILVGSRP
jgi:hypothetical protein